MANKRKKTTSIVAGVTAVALLLGGTFAWTSISQQAKNEAAGIVNVGGRLHDDFNGTNKDVYVENFTDPLNGGQPIYARVKLTEYMEVGQDAGGFGEDTNNDGKVTAVPVVNDTNINDKDNWPVHIPAEYCETCNTGDTCLIHDHWKWTMGGQDENNSEGKTVFMPTFNKDKDSLDADINGTYAGTNPDDKVYYDDYVVYTTEEGGITVNMNDANFTAPDGATYATPLTEAQGNVSSVIGTAYYDDDTNTNENDHENQIGVKVENETHTAKETAGATVITMNEWLTTYNSQPGNYWVYDTDGWAYWANPIMPGEATGLLLDGINMEKNPGEKCYYAINVVGQFATVNDWEYFDNWNSESNAAKVMAAAVSNVATVTVTNLDGRTLVNRGESVNFSATTTVGAVSAAATDEYDWIVLDEDLKEIETSTIIVNEDGTATLTVGNEEMSEGLYVAARSKNHGGAVGVSAVAVQLYTVTITAENNTTVLKAGKTLQLNATVVDNKTGAEETSGVNWSVDSTAGSTINENGVLSINEAELGTTELTVTAVSKNGGFIGEYTVTVADKYTIDVTAASNTADVGYTLDLGAAVTKNGAADDTSAVTWSVDSTAGSTISDEGVLTVSVDEKHDAKLTVTATSVADNEVSDTFEVTVYNGYDLLKTAEAGTTEKIRIDNMEWYVLVQDEDEGKALIWAAGFLTNLTAERSLWSENKIREHLNETYFDSLKVLNTDRVLKTTIKTGNNYDRDATDFEYIETEDYIFLLSQADVFGQESYKSGGSVYSRSTTTPEEYTLGTAGIIVTDEMKDECPYYNVLRSPGWWGDDRGALAALSSTGGFTTWDPTRGGARCRPAMWVDLTQ